MMDRALFLAMSGAKQDMQAMQLRANNLANASSTAFKADLEQARAMQAYGEGLPTRVFNMTERPGYSFSQGSTITTGRDLDVTIKGDGWFSVLDRAGQQGYSRVGNLEIDRTGLLKNGNGQVMLGENDTPIIIPLPIAKVEIGSDGTVSVLPKGAPAEAIEQVGRLKMVRPDNRELFKDKDGVFKAIQPGAVFDADAGVTLMNGALEGSNVNAVAEMVGLIDLQRHFEMQVKLMKTAEEMDQASSSLLRMS